MNVVRFQRPVYPFYVNNLFNKVLTDQADSNKKSNAFCSPAVNIQENEEGYELQFSVPGYQKDQFRIRNDDGMLKVKAEVKKEQEAQSYNRQEFSVYSFERSFKLPDNVLIDSVSAKLDDGILLVNIPKNTEVLQNKEFEVPIV